MPFNVSSEIDRGAAILVLSGELDASSASDFRNRIEELAAEADLTRLVLMMQDLSYMASAGLRALVFAKQKLGSDVDLYLVGTQDSVAETIELTGFHHSVVMLDDYDRDQPPA